MIGLHSLEGVGGDAGGVEVEFGVGPPGPPRLGPGRERAVGQAIIGRIIRLRFDPQPRQT